MIPPNKTIASLLFWLVCFICYHKVTCLEIYDYRILIRDHSIQPNEQNFPFFLVSLMNKIISDIALI